ncbi:hypothetical protein P3T76_001857 [Phytophthora citrophthora]|uniref:Uncharacterized protein n=1 Tax=Phytophthora citrophthora TaxID=4793 RepID=A0AAD9GWB1_9STRA|nr:hypothetical protein P3T76_001857 [Phytophthora citrophthora]
MSANPDAQASSRKKAAKPASKPAKPRGKASALHEATDVASRALSPPSSTAATASPSQRRSRSPSLPPNNRPNPRFDYRDYSPGSWSSSQQEATLVSYSGDESDNDNTEGKPAAGAPTTEEHHGDEDTASKSPNNTSGRGGDTTPPPVRHLTLAEGRERARAILAEEKVPNTNSKKRHASQSPCEDQTRRTELEEIFGPDDVDDEEEGLIREPQEITNDLDEQQELFEAAQQLMRTAPTVAGGSHQHDEDSAHQRGYYPPDQGSGAAAYLELLQDPRPLIGGHTSKGAYEWALVQQNLSFKATSLLPGACF